MDGDVCSRRDQAVLDRGRGHFGKAVTHCEGEAVDRYVELLGLKRRNHL